MNDIYYPPAVLVPASTPLPVNRRVEKVRAFFSEDGPLARRFSGYISRPGQIEYAERVAQAIEDSKHLIIEGPTGTGKSLAYLAAALFWDDDANDGEGDERTRFIVATPSITLQEQLIRKDLPALASLFPRPFSFAIRKGRGNYLCRRKIIRASSFRRDDIQNEKDWEMFVDILFWAQKETKEGDKSELTFDPRHVWEQYFGGDNDDCPRSACSFANECYANRAKLKSKAADVIVTNYHVLCPHIDLMGMGLFKILPERSVFVLDEAHRLAEIARGFFGFDITRWTFSRLERDLDKFSRKHDFSRKSFLPDAERFLEEVIRVWNTLDPRGAKKIRFKYKVPLSERFLQHLVNDELLVGGTISGLDREEDKEEIALGQNLIRRVSKLRRCLLNFGTNNDRYVFWLSQVKGRKHSTWHIKASLVDVAPILRKNLFENTRSVVLTSATLAAHGSFSHLIRETGIPENRDARAVESPFTWREKVRLSLPEGMPDPRKNRSEFASSVARMIEKVTRITRGRTLCLFTAYDTLYASRDHLRRLKDYPHRVLVQTEMPTTKLVEEFRGDGNAVLLGVASFWEGVDVPGDALSCVIIDKIPFPNADDPFLDWVKDHEEERKENVFRDYYIPMGIIRFRQGFGRLIRTESDRGVVVLLDPRFTSMNYGSQFLGSIPRGIPRIEPREIPAFLEEHSIPRKEVSPDVIREVVPPRGFALLGDPGEDPNEEEEGR